ncbi:baseplate J/gp47 family protein [Microcoleus sp. A003_D6]|uniref:baseplate J/gp47 family protein n=1 Tax=Microcoleus sp. A003_D6 TaxID=3055266 RepID=UPI002FCF4467
MSIQPPKIDNRSYDEIVNQTVKLAQHFTADIDIWTALVERTSEGLQDRILAEDIIDIGSENNEIIAKADTLVTPQLAKEIATRQAANLVKVKVKDSQEGQGNESVKPTPELLKDRILNENIIDIDGQIIAKTGESVNDTLAKKIAEVKTKLVKVKGWQGDRDAGMGLIRIFGRMAALVSDRLNQAPDKNFLAFLDLIGTQIQPPQPARVPLTFKLVEGSSVEALVLVPAGTQVSAPPLQSEDEEVVFETEQDLAVVSNQIKAVFFRDPSQEKYSDRTQEATGKNYAVWSIFVPEKYSEHYLYLASNDLFAISGNTVTFAFASHQAEDLKKLFVTWSYWDGSTWQHLDLKPEFQLIKNGNLKVKIDNFPILKKLAIDGLEAEWLRVKLDGSKLSDWKSSPLIDSVSVHLEVKQEDILPDLCFFNSTPIDLSKSFYPFGEQPRINDTFYFASQEVFAKAGVAVKVKIKMSQSGFSENVEIIWEVSNGSNWEEMGRSIVPSNSSNSNSNNTSKLEDGTKAFTEKEEKEVTFSLPSERNYTVVNGEKSYWIRARIAKGDYGKPPKFTKNNDNPPTYEFKEATFKPPLIESLKLSYTYESDRPISLCRSYNDLTYSDFSPTAGKDFLPFTRTSDEKPTLYLGFDRPFPNRAIALYLQVEPPQPGEIAEAIQAGNKPTTDLPRIIWEYYNTKGWVSLGVKDETNAFTQRGIIEFIGPPDFTHQNEFGQTLYWIRARWESGEFLVQPRLRRILTNTIWASQVITIKEELLGSSDGQPKQTYRTAQFPVLKGQRLEVRSPQVPSADELAALEKSLGKNALTIVRDDLGRVEEVWVMWEKVRDFYGSSQTDRHYIIDHLTGLVQFGDGVQGMIPPQGRNNIRLAQYRTGGGEKGNLAENRIAQLKTTIPYVESVTNLEAAGGGAEQESLERVKERGPKWLRHRDRAVTIQDFEDLAYEASTEVARAKAIGLTFNPVEMQWIPVFRLSLSASGDIKVTLTQIPSSKTICVQIYGPGKATPYIEQTLRSNEQTLTLTYNVTTKQYELGKEWTVILTNPENEIVASKVAIVYPTGLIEENLQIPPRKPTKKDAPNPEEKNAKGEDSKPDPNNAAVVKLILVPQSGANQPTPSIALINLVKQYICDRSSPALQLQVTEPNWVEVSVTATVVPVSWESADRVKEAAVNRLQEFLHPLTGGKKRQGWEFGRIPYPSDLYAALEKIEGIDYVESLSVASVDLPADRQDQCLIFSGSHQVTLGRRSP